MNLLLVVLAYLCCRSIACDVAPRLFLYVPRETKLKDDSSNDEDWVRDLRFILIAAKKNYVLDAPLGDRPIVGADADVMNVWLDQYDDYLIV